MKIRYKILSFVLVLCMSLGLFMSPSKAYASSVSTLGTSVAYTSSMLTTQLYNETTAGVINMTSSGVYVSRNYLNFRIWITMPHAVAQGRPVQVKINLVQSSGSINIKEGYFGTQQNGYGCDKLLSNIVSDTGHVNGYFTFSQDFTLTEACNKFALEIDYSVRNSDVLILYVESIEITYKDQVNNNEQLSALNGTSLSIFDRIGLIFSSLTNLPTNIGNALKSFFDSLGTKIQNLPSAISGFFTALGDRFEASSVLVRTVIGNIHNNFTGLFEWLGAKIGDFFKPLTDKVGEIFTFLFVGDSNLSEKIEQYDLVLESYKIKISNALDSLGDVNAPESNDLPDIEQYIPHEDGYIVTIFKRLYQLEHVQTLTLLSIAFGLIGYLFFGKR